MANTDYRGNILGASGLCKVIIDNSASGSPLTRQVLAPTSTRTGAPVDGTTGAGGVTGQTVRPVRVLVSVGTGAISLWDSVNLAGASNATLLWSVPVPSTGGSYLIDIPTVNGLWVSVGANTTCAITFS